MNCDRATPLLGAFVDGELTFTEERAVRSHLASCVRCSARLEAVAALRTAVRSTRPERSDEGLEALHRRLDATPARSRRSGAWVGIAAALAFLVTGSLWVARERSMPPEPASPAGAVRAEGHAVVVPGTPCAEAMDCGADARELWPALDI